MSEASHSPPDPPSSHGMAEALDGARTGNGAATPHTSTPVPLRGLQRTGHPATPPEPGSLPSSGKRKASVRKSRSFKPGLVICSQKHPHERLGDKKKERNAEDRS